MRLFGIRLTPLRVILFFTVILLATLHPQLRFVIWWILPLGSGYDDIIGGLALIVIGITLFIQLWTQVLPSSAIRKVNSKRYDV